MAVLLMGDLNTDPFDVEGHHIAAVVPAILGARELGLRSAYELPVKGDRKAYTTWKRRGDYEARPVQRRRQLQEATIRMRLGGGGACHVRCGRRNQF